MLNEHWTPPVWPSLRADWRRLALSIWLVAVVAVTTLSLLPQTAPPGDHGLDKLIHAASYFALALLPHAAFENRKVALAAAFAMIPLGCAIELAQGFVPARFGDVWDVVANSCGALAALALGARFRQIVATTANTAR